MFCRQTIGWVASLYDKLTKAGITIAFVHMSTEENAAPIFAKYGLPDAERFSDPQKTLYAGFGLRQSPAWKIFKPSVIARSVVALLSGYTQGKVEGDPYQLGGAFLIHKGVVKYEFRSVDFSDQADFAVLCNLKQGV